MTPVLHGRTASAAVAFSALLALWGVPAPAVSSAGGPASVSTRSPAASDASAVPVVSHRSAARRVTPALSLEHRAAVARRVVVPTGDRTALGGRLTGPLARSERTVVVQMLRGRTWHDVAAARSSGKTYRVVLPPAAAGVRFYRAVVPSTPLRAAPTPGRTIGASGPPRPIAVSATLAVAAGVGDERASSLFAPPFRWDPCRPIGYRVNLQGAPPTAAADVEGAVARIAQATGLRLVYRGATTLVPGQLSAVRMSAYPSDTQVVIAFVDPRQSRFFDGQGDAIGYGGAFHHGPMVRSGGRGWLRARQGFVLLDRSADLAPGFGGGTGETRLQGTWGQLLMHEIGHSVGLDHPRHDDARQIMHAVVTDKPALWGRGDLIGLRSVGAGTGCFPREGRLRAAGVAPVQVWGAR